MIRFYIFLGGVILLVTAAAMWAARYVTVGEKLTRLKIYTVLFNIGSTLAMGWCWGNMSSSAKMILHLFTIFMMAEVGFILFVSIGAGLRYLKRLVSTPLVSPVDERRRKLLKGAVLYPTAAAAASLYGGLVGKDGTVVNSYDIPLKEQSHKSLDGYRIIQLSDVHCGPFLMPDRLEELLKRAAGLGGDVLVLTGDIFDDNETNEEAIETVNRYCDGFKDGIVFIFGNHEYFRNMSVIQDTLSRSKIKVLRNQSLCLAGKEGTEASLYLAGVDYPRRRDAFDRLAKEYTEEAYKNIPQGAISVLLAHHPDFIDRGAEQGAAAVLTGHTHGGQIGLLGVSIAPPLFKYMRGIYNVDSKGNGKTFGYVHSGNGSWFPFRLGCPPEIAVFTLKA